MSKIAASGSESGSISHGIFYKEAWIRGSGSTPTCHGSATLIAIALKLINALLLRHLTAIIPSLTQNRIKGDEQLDDVGQRVGLAEHAHHRRQRPDHGAVRVPTRIVRRHLDEDAEDKDGELGLVEDGRALRHQGPLELGHLVQQAPALHALRPHLRLRRHCSLLVEICTRVEETAMYLFPTSSFQAVIMTVHKSQMYGTKEKGCM
jgi:hypothetical protein